MDGLNWAVCYMSDKKHDGEENRTRTIAAFWSHWDAENYINNILPPETRDRFFIVEIVR